MQNRKIFGIGLNKTGTSTFANCCSILGLKVAPFDYSLLFDVAHNRYDRIFDIVDRYGVFEDWPYPLIYPLLDERYPNSKFVLTTRKSPEKWLASQKKHSLYVKPMRLENRIVYGHYYPDGHEKTYIDRYLEFNQHVRNYFKGRPDDLLEICWEENDGWDSLCSFLGYKARDEDIPHVNHGHDYRADFKRKMTNRLFALLFRNQNDL